MNTLFKYLGLAALTVTLAACGGNDTGPVSNPDPAPDPDPEPEVQTIVDVAASNDDFSTLVTALQTTGLDATLDDEEGNFTVFAPTDDAFARLGEDTLNALLDDPETLSDILRYHVVEDAELDSDAFQTLAGGPLEMANGQNVGLSLDGESLLVNLSTVTMTDIEADNGVIHVIDTVLTPPGERGEPDQTIAQVASGNENLGTLVAALGAADLVGTLDSTDETFTVFAPTDEAFAALGQANVDALLADTDALSNLLLQHVIQEEEPGDEVNSIAAFAANGTPVETLSGDKIPVSIVEAV